ncbi:hypothetical protein CVT26_011788 [Gymnopilus dilepis]|uniref:Uncharacterized protein n=1 Tax=Gymnopilus dilepis TaxID=231916 RepID=A0A409WX37_9AGAR|nr:hypothetical protein CVT26_011788 [Gymnopilus dilepis]
MQASPFETVLLRLTKDAVFIMFHGFDVRSLFAVARTSKLIHCLYRIYSKSVWDPDTHYGRWFHDVAYFKELLHHTGAVVSGSFALQFFGRLYYPSSDMDIFLRAAGADDFCSWLREEGYYCSADRYEYGELAGGESTHYTKAVANKTSFHDPLLGVYAFKKDITSLSGKGETLCIQIIVVDVDPVQHILFDFHSTCVMNFLTAFEGVSVFPWSTFVDRVSYISRIRRENEARVSGWTKKYEKRGFLVKAGGAEVSQALERGSRFVGDRHSWNMVFDGESLHFAAIFVKFLMIGIPTSWQFILWPLDIITKDRLHILVLHQAEDTPGSNAHK